MIEELEARRSELKQAEAQAIHALGVIAGRLEELERTIELLKQVD